MKIKKTVLLTVFCLWITVCTVQTMGRARRLIQPPAQPMRPDRKSLQGLTGEQKAKAINKSTKDFLEQRAKAARERNMRKSREAWKRLLRINQLQWEKIGPKIDKIEVLLAESRGGARSWGLEFDGSFHWNKHSELSNRVKAPDHEVVIERKKVADELVDLLEDENSKDEEIRKKIDQLHQIRERARKELAEVRKELAALPTTARQEAILLLTTFIE
jgi:hypothetical protein